MLTLLRLLHTLEKEEKVLIFLESPGIPIQPTGRHKMITIGQKTEKLPSDRRLSF